MKDTARSLRKAQVAIISTLLVLAVAIAGVAIAMNQASSASADADSVTGMMAKAPDAASSNAQASGQAPAAQSSGDVAATPADDCTVTINYLEYADYEDPDAVYDDMGRRVLGTRTLTGLHEGQELNAWDYVVNLPGHFFFDGWPLNMTVSADPAQNVFDLIYVKLYDSEYTVNYYLMTGADLTADTWTGALSTGDVEFYKMGSETFENQRFDELVNGDAYEYMLDGLYVIDTYPAQIRLGTDPDNNVINVLYTPESTYLPDDLPVPDEVTPPEEPDDSATPGTPDLPADEVVDYDHLITVLPDDKPVPSDGYDTTLGEIVDDEIKDDFLGSDIDRGEAEITDEMLEHPVNKEDAENTIKAYQTGLEQGANAQTRDTLMPVMLTLLGIAVVALVVLAVLLGRSKGKARQEQH